MAKELPYFQFEPAEYLTRDISFCSLAAQGLFTNLCSYYWQRECNLTKSQFLRRLDYPTEFEELIEEGVVDLDGEDISIKFLDLQYAKATKLSETNKANGSKGGRPPKNKPKKNRIESELKANLNPNESETKGIREDKIKEDNKIEGNYVDPDKLMIYINKTLGKKYRVIPKKALKQLKERLKEGYTKEDFAKVIDNASKDKYHIETNYKYLTIEFLTRSDKFERFLNMSDFTIKQKMI